jgi:DNA-binding MarR family transcriptional regulator
MELDLSGIRRALRRPLESEIAKGGLTVPQTAVMRVVVSRHGLSLKDLSREVSLAHSTVSGIVDRLERRGMIERRADAEDGRTSRIYPTAVVAEFVRKRIPRLSRGPLETALQRATMTERASIGKALRRLRELLEADSM